MMNFKPVKICAAAAVSGAQSGRLNGSINLGAGLSALLLTILFLAVPIQSRAQLSGKGAIAGTVADPTGAVVSGATVTATNDATRVNTAQQTTSAGYYNISNLDPGVYTVTVTATGFQQTVQHNVVVDALQSVGLNPKLTIGRTDQTVTVDAAPPQLDTTDATLGATMENEMYSSLPLEMGANGSPDQRRATDFVYLMPGVQNNETNGNATDNSGPVNGSGPKGGVAEIYIDGIAMTSTAGEGDPRFVWTAIGVEAINQFQVQTNGISAQYQGQGLENYTIKSGTNAFHGSLYEFFRNTALDTFGYFAKRPNIFGNVVKPAEHQNEYGIVLSGPIIKDKLFLFINYGGYRYAAGANYKYQTGPTTAMLAGDFTAFPQSIYDPTSQTCTAGNKVCTRAQYQGVKNGVATKNVIPAGQITPQSKFLQSFLPPPTNSQNTNNYLTGYSSGLTNWSTTNRLDYDINAKQQLSFIFAMGRQASVGLAGGASNQLPVPYNTNQIYAPKTHDGIAEDTWTINSRMVNQLKFAFGRYEGPTIDPSFTSAYSAAKAGITGLPGGAASGAFPKVTFSGADAQTQWAGHTPSYQVTNAYSLVDNFQWVKGKHSLTLGLQMQWLQYNNISIQSGIGFLTTSFSDSQTGQFKANTSAIDATTGANYASFLIGAASGASYQQNSQIETAARFRPISPYIQDDYKATKNLTLNLGLRWDIYPPFREAHNASSFMNPNLANPLSPGTNGALEFAGSGPGSCHCSTPVSTYFKNIEPRLGAAYKLNEKTVVRGSYGVMLTHGNATGGGGGPSENGTGALGYSASPSLTPINGAPSAPVWYWNTPFPVAPATLPIFDPSYGTAYSTVGKTTSATVSIADPYYGSRAPQYINWSVGLQREITRNMTITASYVGSQGHFEAGGARGPQTNTLNPSFNDLGPSGLLTASATPANVAAAHAIDPNVPATAPSWFPTNQSITQLLKPFPQYSGVNDTYGFVGNSAYHALQLTLIQRATRGLSFMLNYAYSKAIDDDGTIRNRYNNRLDRSLSLSDEPQNLTATSVYQLPFGRGHMGGDNMLVRAVASDWQLSGIFFYHSGDPLAITATGCPIAPTYSECMPVISPGFKGTARINGSWGAGATAATIGGTPYISGGGSNTVFTLPAAYSYGTTSRTAPLNLWAPGDYNIDMGLRRTFPIWESVKFTLQADVLNVTNKVLFGGIGTKYSPKSQNGFGEATSQANQSRDIQLAARLSW